MKPTWDDLAKEYEGRNDVLIVDVDCTKDGSKDLCSKYGVRGYPTIKYFTASTDAMGDAYEGGRDIDSLRTFAEENLGPSCSPDNLDLCDDDQKAEIAKYEAFSQDDLQAKVDSANKAVADAEKTFKDEVSKLQKKYESLMADKDAAVKAAATPELKFVKMVLSSKKAAAKKDEL